jgi:hypothetical protein
VGKSSPICFATFIIKKLPEANNGQIGEYSPNLATLTLSQNITIEIE